MLLDAGLEPQMTWGFHMNSIPHQVFPDPIKQQQQQKQQRQPCNGWIVAETLATIGKHC